MFSVNFVIVSLDTIYNNEKRGIIVNSEIENVEYVNRVATVIESPKGTILQKGDKVICHHNLFRQRYGFKGELIESNYHLEDNIYFIPPTEIFMYKRGSSDWFSVEPFCFVEPINRAKKQGFDLSLSEDSYKGNLKQHGILQYPNKYLLSQGLKKGDLVFFSKYSEYEFEIDNKIYYKMSSKDILLVKDERA